MPTASSYPAINIPAVDLWGLMFEEKRDEPFPADKGMFENDILSALS